MTDEKYDDEPIADFDTEFDPVEEGGTLFTDRDDDRPDMGSEEWSDWVISLLRKDEYPNERPTCDGLRRIAIKLFGPMDILPPAIHACERTYAAVTVRLKWPLRTVCASAEVHENNCDAPFVQYPLGTAETRAMSRCLRMALNLRKVITAEEGSRKADISVPVTDDVETGGITDNQKRFIDLMCKSNDISVKAVVTEAVGEHEKLEDLSNAESKQVQKLLDEWSKEKPDDIDSYDPNWRSSF